MASAERTVIAIPAKDMKKHEKHEVIFNHQYARQMCELLLTNEKAFREESRKYDKKLAKRIYQLAIKEGEEEAMPLYLKNKEAYEKYQDIGLVIYLVQWMGGDCTLLEKEGYFGKR